MPESPSGTAGICGAVKRWADDEMRSANGQVEWILRDALKRAGRLPKKEGGAKDDKA